MICENLKKIYFLKAIGYKFINEDTVKKIQYYSFNTLDSLNSQIKNCTLCHLKNSSDISFIGHGDTNSRIMFVFFKPHTDIASKKKFNHLIQNVGGFDANQYYTTSLLRCKSKENIDTNEPCKRCLPYLLNEIEIINPKVVVALGDDVFLNLYHENLKNMTFDTLRGSFLNFGSKILIPTYSISKIIKNPSLENTFLTDLNKIKGVL